MNSRKQQETLDIIQNYDISDRKLDILFLLARYKFLTAQQIARLFGIKTSSSINTLLKELHYGKYPLIDSKGFGVVPIHGKLARMNFLTKYGVMYLENSPFYEGTTIKYPRNKGSLFKSTYFHKRRIIDFNVALSLWLEGQQLEYDFFNYDFDQIGSNRTHNAQFLNKIQLSNRIIIPDGISLFYRDGTPYLILLEQHNDHDSGKAVKQIKEHCQAINEGAPSDKFNIKKGARVYFVFEKESCMNAVIKRLKDESYFSDFDKFFYFKTVEHMRDDFENNWFHVYSEPSKFIDTKK